MKSSRKRGWLLAAVLAAALAARADLPRWFQDVPAVKRYEGVFTAAVSLPSGPVVVRRQPQETRTALTGLIAGAPNEAEMYALRAHVEEEQLDAAAAEADWIQYAKLAPDAGAGQLALADFYHRRLQVQEELRALEAAAQAENPPAERFLPAARQRSWGSFERALALIDAQALPAEAGNAAYRQWIKRYPLERAVYQRYLAYAVAKRQYAAAEALIAEYRRTFPDDASFPTSARATLEERRGAAASALAVYDKAFDPLWPPDLIKSWFALLDKTHSLRSYLASARAALAANPSDLGAAARIFYYYQQQGNLPAAQRALIEFRQRKDARQSAWSITELWTLGRLFEAVHNYDEAARDYHAMYALAGATPADRERALAAIANLLFTAPDQPIHLGAGDLSYYKDIATMDPHPGFLNGILSLVLNSTQPQWRYSDQERAAVAYFHRARAAELVALFDATFPKSNRRPELKARLLEAYAAYGDHDGVIRAGRQFLATFPGAPERTNVALRMAEAYARKGQLAQEFATYDALLKELAARAQGVPLGEAAGAAPPETQQEEGTPVAGAPRSPEYARVLDRYISRLVSLKRPLEALKLLRAELDRNPNDPGLYARLAAFLEQNRLEAEIEQVYRGAIQQFRTMAWYDKLGRWYVRRKQAAQLEQLTRQVVDTFAGTELERYFRETIAGAMTPALSLRLNLYAHERFPYDLQFVRNLIGIYGAPATYDAAALERLLRNYWFYADDLRARYFALLASSGRLNAELSRAVWSSPAAVQFTAEAEVWRSHFEAAAAPLETVAAQFPADASLAMRAASLDRSLAAFDPKYTARAVAIAERLHRFDLRDHTAVTQIGEIWAEREQFARARPWWERLAQIEPGNPDGYVEAATVFWDYYQFDDALRLLAEGRKQAGNATLYAYEAGAIYEGKRDFARAISEYSAGAASGSSARTRLITLARRPARQALIDKLTAERVAGPNPEAADVSLRLAVLEAANRGAEVERFLTELAGRTTSVDLLATVRAEAEARGLDSATVRILEREIAVTTDPVDRMRSRLALMRFHDGRGNVAEARRVVEELYRENPAILGVVRAAVDFYWRNKLPREAVNTLAQAAVAANASFAKQFTLEAARKATESGEYARARQFAGELLKGDPFRAEYVAAMADVYVREGDDRGLRSFYEDRLQALRSAPFAAAERTSRIAALRRNLIPVLTRQKDYAGAIDQYIEILRSYPEDDGLARDAASYASDHNARERLHAYFTKAAADSPRDFRWPMVLARIETGFEDLPAAIAAYSRATAVRPDRVDLHMARASLEERLMRFDDALQSYRKLYDLTYRNPQWMEKAAEAHARLGRREEAVKALRAAFLDGRPERPQPFFDIARILEGWNLLVEARPFAERGLVLAGGDLAEEYAGGAAVYARVMTRLRGQEIAVERLRAVVPADSNAFRQALNALGEAVARYFTPEEKAALEAFLEKEKAVIPAEHLLTAVNRAGMAGLEAKWRFELMMSRPGEPAAEMHVTRLVELQRQRVKNDELGVQLEAYWQAHPDVATKDALLDRAAGAFRLAGNAGAELRVLSLHQQRSGLGQPQLARYFDLLAANAPARLVLEAQDGRSGNDRDLAANAAVASGNVKLALEAVRARGRGRPPVWTNAYTGLAGVYFGEASPAIQSAFTSALGETEIGRQLGQRPSRDQQLAGSVWFYYGTAYGEWLALSRSGGAEDYLPALVEGTPAHAGSYAMLGDYYRDTGAADRALADYGRVIELDAKRGDVHDRMAALLWDANRRDEATAHWKAAFAAFRVIEDARLPETFWNDVPTALENIGSRKLLAAVRTEADAVLRTYIRRNGYYRAERLIDGALAAAAGSPEGAAWILDLSRVAPNPIQFLQTAADSKVLTGDQREAIYRRILEQAAAEAAQPGPEHTYAEARLREWQLKWIAFLLDQKQTARARAALTALPESVRRNASSDVAALEVRVFAAEGRLGDLIDSWQREPDRRPPLETLRESAVSLRTAGGAADANRLLEFVYTRELEAHNLTGANFLGLAEVRLEQKRLGDALAVLRRMTLVADAPFEDLVPAAALLEKNGHTKEAREFLAARAKAVPWDLEARAKLGDAAVASSPEAPYAARIEAARTVPVANPGSGELALVAGGGRPDAAAVEKPYFYYSRLAAADAAPDAGMRARLLASAIAIDPQPAPPRVRLLRAALEAGNFRLALAAYQPALDAGPLRWILEQTSESDVQPNVTYYAEQFAAGEGDAAGRAAVARDLGRAEDKLDQLAHAELFYRISLEIAASAEARSALEAVRTEQRRRAEDAARRPVIGAGLEQARLVRPRVERGASR